MQSKGYSMTGDQCRSKINNLLTTYKRTKDKNQQTGTERVSWEYYAVRSVSFPDRQLKCVQDLLYA